MRQNEHLCGTTTKHQRDFHRHVRVVYRAYRKIYGLEKTQDECLRVFKLVFPEFYKAEHSDNKYWKFSDSTYDHLASIFEEWMPEEGVLRDLLCYILDESSRLMLREEFMLFCLDIMPVAMKIRKLTPRETGRLMGLTDEEIDKMFDAGLSNSNLYKLHGNSIVTNVMTALFDKLIVNTEQEKIGGLQLSLF